MNQAMLEERRGAASPHGRSPETSGRRSYGSFLEPVEEVNRPFFRLCVAETSSEYVVLICAHRIQANRMYVICRPEAVEIEYRYRAAVPSPEAGEMFQESELVHVQRTLRLPFPIQRKTCRLRWTAEGLVLRVEKAVGEDEDPWSEYIEVPQPADYARNDLRMTRR